MDLDFLVQLVLLLLGWYLDRKAARAKRKNSPVVVIAGDVYVINIHDKD